MYDELLWSVVCHHYLLILINLIRLWSTGMQPWYWLTLYQQVSDCRYNHIKLPLYVNVPCCITVLNIKRCDKKTNDISCMCINEIVWCTSSVCLALLFPGFIFFWITNIFSWIFIIKCNINMLELWLEFIDSINRYTSIFVLIKVNKDFFICLHC